MVWMSNIASTNNIKLLGSATLQTQVQKQYKAWNYQTVKFPHANYAKITY